MGKSEKAGHRQRLRSRFLNGEESAYGDERLLELLLTFTLGRQDTLLISRALIDRFGSLQKVLSAAPDELLAVKGIGAASATLLKVIHYLSPETPDEERETTAKPGSGPEQQMLFGDFIATALLDKPELDVPDSDSTAPSGKVNRTAAETDQPGPDVDIPHADGRRSKTEKQTPSPPARRKLQVSNGYFLDFNQLAQLFHVLYQHKDAKKISRKTLQEETGLAKRNLGGLVSMGAAMGLIRPGLQILTETGLLVAEHDMFFEKRGTLEWLHFKGAGSYQNLIWFDAFNHLLAEASPETQDGWCRYFRGQLSGHYSEKTVKDHVSKEVRFVIDAYMKRNFKEMGLLQQTDDERIYRRRYTEPTPPVFSAMIYDFFDAKAAQLFQVSELASTPGSPAVVFGLDLDSCRRLMENPHDRGWLRYETTHNLDQIRLKSGLTAVSFLTSYYTGQTPQKGGRANEKRI